MILITPQLLAAALPSCPPQRAELFAPHLQAACHHYAITATPERLAAFLAQVGVESGSLLYTAELWGPTPQQTRYEGRADLGNTQPGDGPRFRGRGLIQTTGRYNHQRVRDRLRAAMGQRLPVPDFELAPQSLEQPLWASWSAADYWDWKGLNALADAGQFERITRLVNGGLTHHDRRVAILNRALPVVRAAAVGQVPATAPEEASSPAPALQPAPIHASTSKEATMPLASFIAAALPRIVKSVVPLGKLFGSGSEVSERNVKAAELAVQIVTEATGARNAQEAVEILEADPTMAKTATEAVQARWHDLTEAGGGGIEGARKADAAVMFNSGPWWQVFRSPSFWFMAMCMPVVYAVVGSIVGLWGQQWPDDVRAAIATAVVSLIVGGGAGYYWGQTTSRNRTPSA